MQREFQRSERTKRAARVAAVARFLSDDLLEQLPEPTRVGETKVGGIDLNKSRMRRVAEGGSGFFRLAGELTTSELAQQVRSTSGQSGSDFRGLTLTTNKACLPSTSASPQGCLRVLAGLQILQLSGH
jgi:hypothetical protein